MTKKRKDYNIIFKKLDQAQKEGKVEKGELATLMTPEEIDEIEELHRFVLELQEEEPQSYTST